MTPPPMPHCDGCPARAAGLPCRGGDRVARADGSAFGPTPHLCDRLAADPARWAPAILRMAREDAGVGAPPPLDMGELRDVLYRACGRTDRVTLPPGCGVLLAADDRAFVGLQLTLASVLLGHDLPATVFDLGLTADQRAWLARQPVDVRTPTLPEGIDFHREDNRWALWAKAAILGQSPHRRTLWLDSDTFVRADLRDLFAAIDAGPMVMPDSFATDPAVLRNRPELYARYPVPEEWPSLNSGVIGWDAGRGLDREWLRRAAWLLSEAIADPSLRPLIACWDQGCFKWAAESLGIRPTDDRAWNSPGWTVGEVGRRLEPWEVVARVPEGAIGHFQSHPKPWHAWGPTLDIELATPANLRVFALGHSADCLAAVPPRPFVEPVNLTALDPDQAAGENRFCAHLPADPPEYVGLASWRWDRKWCPPPHGALPVAELHRLAPHLRPDRVFAPGVVGPDEWPDAMAAVHTDAIRPTIAEVRALRGHRGRRGPTFWSQNFVAHRDVLADFLAFHAAVMAHVRERYGPDGPAFPVPDGPRKPIAWVGEICMLVYAESRTDLAILPARVPADAPEPPLPPAPRMAANLAGAVARTAGRALSGKSVTVDDATYAARLAICKACPHWRPSDGRCSLCGCRTGKLRLSRERCPANPPKWGAVD